MKIAFVNQVFDPVLGECRNSIGLWSYMVGRLLAKEHEVSVHASNSYGFDGKQEIVQDGIRYVGHSVGADERRLRRIRLLKLLYHGRRPLFATRWYYPGYYKAVAASISDSGADIIHVHNFPHALPWLRRANPQAAIVLHMHCDWLAQVSRDLVGPSLRHADQVLACSEYIADNARQAHPEHAGKVSSLYNGFNACGFFPEPKRPSPIELDFPYLLFVGRGSPEKGVHVLAKAFSCIRRSHPELHLVLVGGMAAAPKAFVYDLAEAEVRKDMTGCWEGAYQEIVEGSLDEQDRSYLHVLDAIPHEQLVGLYQNAVAHVFPSLFQEPFGMPVLEAIACGTPQVVSHCGGLSEFFVFPERTR